MRLFKWLRPRAAAGILRARLRPHFGTRKTRLGVLGGVVAIGAIGVAAVAIAGTIGTASGFEDDDGNLAVDSAFDWNGFSPVTWTGTAPNQTASKTVSGWAFTGLTDAQATTSDSGYAGGVKQDVDCATIKGSKAPNKDDLKRIYLSSKTVNGHVYLNLAWVRIPQNTVNASTHVGFEFNQSKTACGSSSDGLVQRTAGDLLFVYDFEGSNSGAATLTVRKWVTSGSCDISSDSPPCWGVAQPLTASGFAEAKVNEQPVCDALAPGSNGCTGNTPTETLGVSEFGEAGVDLTAAGIFQPGVCTAFGQAEGVSRSSGNSGQAAMEDLVGPGKINLTNCGTVTIIKNTDPRGISQAFGYTSNLAGSTISCTPDTTPASFTLNDGSSTTNTEECTNVPIGSYTVTEGAEPTGFTLESLTCTATGSGSGSQDGTNPAQANITIAAGLDHVTCTYVNQQQLGAIKITKTNSKTSNGVAGATFLITGPGGYSKTVTSGSDGTVCTDGLAFGTYSVSESSAPTGYSIDDTTTHNVGVNTSAKCSDSPYVGASTSFTDTPLSDIQVNFRDGGSGTTSGTISCDNTSGTTSTTTASGWDTSKTVTGVKAPTTIHCTITIDP
jgi:prealbumin domain-containing protein